MLRDFSFGRRPLISLVVPSYNVSAYFDRFMESIIAQSSGTDDVEVIVVNDGSTDNTGEIANDWQRRHPHLIKVIHQENGGLCAARNTGLDAARGAWISFPDPDDFYDPELLKHVRDEIAGTKNLLTVTCNYIIYRELTGHFDDIHALKYRFTKGLVRVPTGAPKTYVPTAVNSTFIRCKYIRKHGLTFDGRVRPSFEDGHFLTRLLLLEPKRTASFLPSAKYYYRKRADESSLLDSTKTSTGWYLDELEFGFKPLIELARSKRKGVPEHLRAILQYHMMWRVRFLVNNDNRIDHLTAEQRERFKTLFAEVIDGAGPGIIKRRQLAGCNQDHKVGLLWKYWRETPLKQIVQLRQHDHHNDEWQFSICTPPGVEPDIVVEVDGSATAQRNRSCVTSTFLDEPYIQQNYFWVKIAPGQRVSVRYGETQCEFKSGGHNLGVDLRWEDLLAAINPRDVHRDDCTPQENELRAYAVSKAARERFAGCWVITDHDRRADDNGEHFYRYLMSIGQHDRAVFVIGRDTRDWDRLEAEGFNLVEAGTRDHAAALVQCNLLLSSHADHFIRYPFGRQVTGDLEDADYVFLQHGVTYNDMSNWFNGKFFKYVVTSARWETDAIASSANNYLLSRKSIAETGMPRHDALLEKKRCAAAPDVIVVAPTWRRYLTDHEKHGNSMKKVKRDDFMESVYARSWRGLICSDELSRIAEKQGLKIVFAPHPNMQMYIDEFELPDRIELFRAEEGGGYQELFCRAAVLVTDFSSVAFEAAYLMRPVVYYQFDKDDVYQPGAHVYSPSDWQFENDGFGPVASSRDAALEALERALSGQEDPVYASRRFEAFDFRDGKCCERLYQLLADGKRPDPNLGQNGLARTESELKAMSGVA